MECEKQSYDCYLRYLEALFALSPTICAVIAIYIAHRDVGALVDACDRATYTTEEQCVDPSRNQCEFKCYGYCSSGYCQAYWELEWVVYFVCSCISIGASALGRLPLICHFSYDWVMKFAIAGDFGIVICSALLVNLIWNKVEDAKWGTYYLAVEMFVVSTLWLCYVFAKSCCCESTKSEPQIFGNHNLALQNIWNNLHAQHADLVQRGIIRPPIDPSMGIINQNNHQQSFHPPSTSSQILYSSYNNPKSFNQNSHANASAPLSSGMQTSYNPYKDSPPKYDFAFEIESASGKYIIQNVQLQ